MRAEITPLHIPRRSYDPVRAIVWCVVIPFACGYFWYWIIRALHALWVRL